MRNGWTLGRLAVWLVVALGGCGRDWDRFAEGDGAADGVADQAMSMTPDMTAPGPYVVQGVFVGGGGLQSGGMYEVRGRLMWQGTRLSGGNYVIEGGLR